MERRGDDTVGQHPGTSARPHRNPTRPCCGAPHHRKPEKLEKACRGNTFGQRRDAAILSVFRATGIRLAELAGIRYDADDADRSDLDLERREIKVRGKGGRDRTVMIDHEAARRLDRYLRVRVRHEQAYRLGLWLGTGGRGPLSPNGVYQMVRRRGEQAGGGVWPHRFPQPFTEAGQGFAAAPLLRETDRANWEEVGGQDGQQWVGWLLERYSHAYASNQFRALQQFFKWLAAEEEIPDPMAGLKPPYVPERP